MAASDSPSPVKLNVVSRKHFISSLAATGAGGAALLAGVPQASAIENQEPNLRRIESYLQTIVNFDRDNGTDVVEQLNRLTYEIVPPELSRLESDQLNGFFYLLGKPGFTLFGHAETVNSALLWAMKNDVFTSDDFLIQAKVQFPVMEALETVRLHSDDAEYMAYLNRGIDELAQLNSTDVVVGLGDDIPSIVFILLGVAICVALYFWGNRPPDAPPLPGRP